MKRVAVTVAVLLGLMALPALAAPNAAPTITITSPEPGVTLATDKVEVTVMYAAPAGAEIARVDLLVDGKVAATESLDPPQAAGATNLQWEAATSLDGNHKVSVRAVDTKGTRAESAIVIALHRGQPEGRPLLRITEPLPEATVTGVTAVQADVPGTMVKYVVFLVDNVFKAMSNIRPYTYNWDTTRYLDGPHTVQVKGYLADGGEALSRVLEVIVSNPSGMTTMRTPAPAAPKADTPPVRSAEPVLPPAVHTESPTPYSKTVEVTAPEVGPPGTAPYVSATGDLITPPTSALAARTPTPQPVQIAAAPATAANVTIAPQPATTSVVAPPQPVAVPTAAATVGPLPAPVPAAPLATAANAPVVAPAAVTAPPAPAAEPSQPVAVSPKPVLPAAAPAQPKAVPVEARPAAPQQIALLPPQPIVRKPESMLIAQPAPTTVTYTVQRGDSLWSIAARYGVTVKQLAQKNHLSELTAVRTGQQVQVPETLIYVNGRPLTADVPPLMADGRTLAPLRAVVERAGGSVTWEPKSHQAEASRDGHRITVTRGSDMARVDNQPVSLGAPAIIQASRMMVPLRFLGDALELALHCQHGVVHVAAKH